MLVSSNSIKVASVTVIATSHGFTAGLLTVCVPAAEMGKACVLTADRVLLLKECLRCKLPRLKRCVRCTQGLKIKTLFELPGYRGDYLFFHALWIFPRIALAGGDQRAGQPVNSHADN